MALRCVERAMCGDPFEHGLWKAALLPPLMMLCGIELGAHRPMDLLAQGAEVRPEPQIVILRRLVGIDPEDLAPRSVRLHIRNVPAGQELSGAFDIPLEAVLRAGGHRSVVKVRRDEIG